VCSDPGPVAGGDPGQERAVGRFMRAGDSLRTARLTGSGDSAGMARSRGEGCFRKDGSLCLNGLLVCSGSLLLVGWDPDFGTLMDDGYLRVSGALYYPGWFFEGWLASTVRISFLCRHARVCRVIFQVWHAARNRVTWIRRHAHTSRFSSLRRRAWMLWLSHESGHAS